MKKIISIILILIILGLLGIGARLFLIKNKSKPNLQKQELEIQPAVDKSKQKQENSAGGKINDRAAAEIDKELEMLEKDLIELDDKAFDSNGL